MDRPTSVTEVCEFVRAQPRVLPRGGGTKPALSTPPDGVAALDLAGLAGVLEYEPGEFTFTALAGTRVAEVNALLAGHGQYLPFDPPLAERGATLGGTVAAGLSGPGRYRSGGVRDFILGVRYVDGEGQVVRGGGKVVKNAAGFDLPKLMVGSLGRLGVLVEVTFKVFPRPEAYHSVRLSVATLDDVLQALLKIYGAPLDIAALDLVPALDRGSGGGQIGSAALWVRLGGLRDALPPRAERVSALLGGGEVIGGDVEAAFWRDAREFAWVPEGWTLAKIPLTPKRIAAFEVGLGVVPALRRYSAGGNVAWVATPEPVAALDSALVGLGVPGLVVFGPAGRSLIGAQTGAGFSERVQKALDPVGRFGTDR